jgi:carboxymethylenebutenolidase
MPDGVIGEHPEGDRSDDERSPPDICLGLFISRLMSVFDGAALSACDVQSHVMMPNRPNRDTSMIRTETVTTGRVNGHIAHAQCPIGGVLLLPTISGIDRFVVERAQQLADAGLTTLGWNPFPGEAASDDLPTAMARAGRLNDGLIELMSECIDYMTGPLQLNAVAVLGFCLGGRYALLHAAQDSRLAACVSFYPSIREPAKPNETLDAVACAAQIDCPVHLVYAENDTVFLHQTFIRLREGLERRTAATIVQVHPGAIHSFMRPEVQSEPANASATRLSWPQAVAFLKVCLAS